MTSVHEDVYQSGLAVSENKKLNKQLRNKSLANSCTCKYTMIKLLMQRGAVGGGAWDSNNKKYSQVSFGFEKHVAVRLETDPRRDLTSLANYLR